MVTEPNSMPVMLNVPVVEPLAIETLLGIVTCPVPDCERVTVNPVDGAGVFKVIVPLPPALSPTTVGKLSEIAGVKTFTVVVALVKPVAEAVIVVLPAPTGVTVMFAVVAPEATVTFAGTVAALVLLLCKLITCPLEPAAADKVRVSIPVLLVATLNGLGPSVMLAVELAVTITVTGVELPYRSLTIS